MTRPIDRCPHCGSTEGIYTKSTFRKVFWYCGFDGEAQSNSDMYDMAIVEGGNMAFCQKCDKPICRLSALQKQWNSR